MCNKSQGFYQSQVNNMIYRNKKTKKLYVVLFDAIDATNARDGEPVTIYRPKREPFEVYVRDTVEFIQKFELVEENEN